MHFITILAYIFAQRNQFNKNLINSALVWFRYLKIVVSKFKIVTYLGAVRSFAYAIKMMERTRLVLLDPATQSRAFHCHFVHIHGFSLHWFPGQVFWNGI